MTYKSNWKIWDRGLCITYCFLDEVDIEPMTEYRWEMYLKEKYDLKTYPTIKEHEGKE